MTRPARKLGTSAPLGGIVLAGGGGRRFGRPKADVMVADRSLAARAADALAPHCDPIVVVVRPETPLPLDLDAQVVYDREGPPAALTAVATGLQALDNQDVVVLACDLIVAPSLIAALANGPSGQAVALMDGQGVQPLCARYPRERALEACERLLRADDLRVRRLAELLAAVMIVAAEGSLTNINTRSEVFNLLREVPRPEDGTAC